MAIDDTLTKAAVDRRPRLTEARLHQLELAFSQQWIKQPLSVDALQLIRDLRRANKALTAIGTRCYSVLALRGHPSRGQGSDDLLTILDLVSEGLGYEDQDAQTDRERAAAPA